MSVRPEHPAELSMGELASKLARDSTRLFQQEAELAKRELSDKLDQTTTQLVSMVVGGAVLYAGLLALVAAAILAFGAAVPLWLSALIIGFIVAGVGGALLQRGKSKITEVEMAPKRTISRVQRDIRIMKEAAQ